MNIIKLDNRKEIIMLTFILFFNVTLFIILTTKKQINKNSANDIKYIIDIIILLFNVNCTNFNGILKYLQKLKLYIYAVH